MARLTCSSAECVHNMSGLCSANTIHIGGRVANTSAGTECDNFAQKGIKNAFLNVANMNVPGEIRQLFRNDSVQMSPSIKCEAGNCAHNVNAECSASDVQIYGPGAEDVKGTQCETFITR